MKVQNIEKRAEELGNFAVNPAVYGIVEPDTDLKNMLVEYVGGQLDPGNKEVTVDMIINVVAEEFPEFVLVLAEENFFRGYRQGIQDINTGTDRLKEMLKSGEFQLQPKNKTNE